MNTSMANDEVIREALRIPFGPEQVAEYDRNLPAALAALDTLLQEREELTRADPLKARYIEMMRREIAAVAERDQLRKERDVAVREMGLAMIDTDELRESLEGLVEKWRALDLTAGIPMPDEFAAQLESIITEQPSDETYIGPIQ